jgi:hypothetical protein
MIEEEHLQIYDIKLQKRINKLAFVFLSSNPRPQNAKILSRELWTHPAFLPLACWQLANSFVS